MFEAGQTIGHYQVVRLLGEGGMGAVYEAVQPDIARKCAIKVLHPQYARKPEIATRFLNEARAANLVEHAGIVEIYDFGRLDDGTTFIVMELLRGKSLRARLEASGKLAEADALRLGRQIASALAATHERGIVHRDLKPDNVVVEPDPEAPGGERAKILDFGIAKVAEALQKPDDHVQTKAGSLLGTPTYMSPEQCRGTTVDAKTDVYALGIMLYQMVSGQPPFQSEGLGELMAMHLGSPPPPLGERVPALQPAVVTLVHAMLEKDAGKRPSMRDVVAALERGGAQSTAVRPATTASGGGSKVGVIAGALALVALVGGGAALLLRKPSPPLPAKLVHWTLATVPAGARVIGEHDEELGRTPWTHEQPPGQGAQKVTLRLQGYFDKAIDLDRGADEQKTEKLTPIDDKNIKILE
jgi:serine/threonine protein kinase